MTDYESNRTHEFTEIPTARYFRYLLVGIRYFSVFVIPTSVSVSVFENTAVILSVMQNLRTDSRLYPSPMS